MKLKTKNFKGVSALVMILGITSIAIAIVVTLSLITYFESNSTFLRQKSSEALLIAESGVYDALYKISQNKNINIPSGYTLDFENGQALVTIQKNVDESGAAPGFFLINSTGSTKAVIGKANKELEVKAAIDETSGKITIISWKEVEVITGTPTTTSTPQLAVRSTTITGVSITSDSGHGGTTNYTKDIAQGTTVSLTAPTIPGYTFSNWSGYISSTSTTISFSMPANDTICIANYERLFAIGPYRKKITIDHNKVDENLTDFSVLVKLTSDNFDFSKARSDGYDIRFTASDGTTLLKYERERHDATNEVAEYWVKIPSISSLADTEFYIYYGKSDATDGADPTNVWDSNFKARYSMKDLTTSTIEDSTSNNNDGTKKAVNEPIQADGQISKAQSFDGVNDYVSIPASQIFAAANLTISAWINASDFTQWRGLFYIYEAALTDYLIIRNNGSSLQLLIEDDNVTKVNLATPYSATGTWVNIVFVQDGTSWKYYKNGMEETLTGTNSEYCTSHLTVNNIRIGYSSWSLYYFNGLIDEVRISNVARSAAWIKASYNSENNSLLTYGSEETGL